jgi:WD40 repeat protein
VDALAFAPDGYTLASGGEDAVALLWDVDVERVASRVCAITAGIERADWETYFPGVDYAPPCADT